MSIKGENHLLKGLSLKILIFLVLLFLPFSFHVFGHEDGHHNHTLEDEVEQLKAANTAWEFNQRELLELSRQEGIPQSEIQEYTEFVTELQHAVFKSCQSVRSHGGDVNAHGVNCIELQEDPQNARAGTVGDIQKQATRQEKAGVLKDKLRQLETDLDDMLLKGQERIRNDRQNSVGSEQSGLEGEISETLKRVEERLGKKSGKSAQDSATASGAQSQTAGSEAEGTAEGGAEGSQAGTGKSQEAGTSGTGEGTQSGSTAKGTESGSMSAGSKTGTGRGSGSGKPGGIMPGGPEAGLEDAEMSPTRDEFGDPSDDDVVARQLREAAEAETDPALKEQLWEEYRKYKKNLR